jgi:pentatricopeptide repeat protein
MLSNKCTVILSYCSQWFSLGAYPWDALYGGGNILAFALASFFSCSRCAPSSQAVQLSSLSLNYMNDVGCVPNVLHFTNLIDGLGHAGNLEAYRYFFDEMFWRVRMSIDVF